MPRLKSEKPNEPAIVNYSQDALIAMQRFAHDTNQDQPGFAKGYTVKFLYALIQLSEQEGFTIEDALREARIRLFNTKRNK
jgi:hypothetical protein